VQSILTSTAVDIEAPGFDNIAGHGRIDALAAVNAVTAPTTTTTIPSVSTSTIPTVVSTTTSTTLPVCDPDDCDGNVCTVGDTCAGAVCQAGSRLTAGQLSGFTLDDTNVATSQCPGDRRKSVKKVDTRSRSPRLPGEV
jgi:hypothetical protein